MKYMKNNTEERMNEECNNPTFQTKLRSLLDLKTLLNHPKETINNIKDFANRLKNNSQMKFQLESYFKKNKNTKVLFIKSLSTNSF